jgi:hypothetical protein
MTRAGTYSVVYRAVAGDGHPVTGSYRFRVTHRGAVAARSDSQSTGGSTGERVAETALETTAAGSGSTSTRWLIGGLGAAGFASLLIAGARRRPEPDEVTSR